MAALDDMGLSWSDADAKAIRDEDYALNVGTGTIEDYGDDWFQPVHVMAELCTILDMLTLDADVLRDFESMSDAA